MLLVACCAVVVAFASRLVPTVAASRTSTGARIARLCMSGLGGTRWTVKLDVGPEPGTWMPPSWGRTGLRALATVDLAFETDGRLQLLGTGQWDQKTVKWTMLDANKTVGAWSVDGEQVTFYLQHEGLEREDVVLEPGRVYATAGAWGSTLGRKGNLCIRQRKLGWLPFLPAPSEASFLVGRFETRALAVTLTQRVRGAAIL